MEKLLKENKMGTDKIPKVLFSLAVPIIISMVVQALYNIVDSIYVAQYNNVEGTAALGLAFPIQNLMIAVGAGLGVGMNAILSRSLGQKNFDKANKTAGQGIFLNLVGYLLFLLFAIFLADKFAFAQAHENGVFNELLYEYAKDYISIISFGSICVFIQITMERLLQATGKSVYSMITQATGAIINIILDPIFIFGRLGVPEMGIKGAAIATVIGQFVAAVLGIIFNLTVNKEIKLKVKNIIPEKYLIRDILIIGVPSVLMQAIGSVMTFSMNAILKNFGLAALNVFVIYFKLQSFVFMPVFGLTNGIIPIVSYNYGAEKPRRVFATIKLGSICSVSYMALGLLAIQTIPGVLLGFFNATAEMLVIGKAALRIISISFVLAGFAIICSCVCQALGKSVYSLILSICRQLGILIPAAYLLSLSGKVNLIWWSFPIAELISLIMATLFLIRVLKKAFPDSIIKVK